MTRRPNCCVRSSWQDWQTTWLGRAGCKKTGWMDGSVSVRLETMWLAGWVGEIGGNHVAGWLAVSVRLTAMFLAVCVWDCIETMWPAGCVCKIGDHVVAWLYCVYEIGDHVNSQALSQIFHLLYLWKEWSGCLKIPDLYMTLTLHFQGQILNRCYLRKKKMVRLPWNEKWKYWLNTRSQLWPSGLTLAMTWTLNFQDQIVKLPYLRKKCSNCQETKNKMLSEC